MCLYLSRDIEKQIATEDIICYKRIIIDFTPYKGKSFTGIIKGIECEGKIQVDTDYAYFCTNELHLDGIHGNNLLGYKYSWEYDGHVESIIVDGVDIMIPTESTTFMTPYRLANVKLGKTYTSELIYELYKVNIGLHSFGNYEDAKNDGHGVVVKCIIPKGAGYYEGKFCDRKSYASNELKYIEIVS